MFLILLQIRQLNFVRKARNSLRFHLAESLETEKKPHTVEKIFIHLKSTFRSNRIFVLQSRMRGQILTALILESRTVKTKLNKKIFHVISGNRKKMASADF